MDDFKPKPIVLKTLTGLHESASLKAVRAALDKLLNLPSLEARRQGSSNGSKVSKTTRFAVPEDKRSPKASAHFSIPIASVASTDSPGLFVIPMNPIRMQVSTEDGNNKPLFSIPANPSTASATSLFSLGGSRSSLSTSNYEPQVKSDNAKKGALFSIPKIDTSDYDVPKTSLFSIPVNPSSVTQESSKKPAALFSIPVNPSSTTGETQGWSSTKPTALFSIPANPSTATTGSQQGSAKKAAPLFSLPVIATTADETKAAPMFSIPVNPATHEQTQGNPSIPVPLFSIPINPTSARETKQWNANNPEPLFSIPIIPNSADETKQGNASDPDALFPLSLPKPIRPETIPESESKKRPLFSLSNHIDGMDNGANKKPAVVSISPADRNPALFSFSTNSGNPEPGANASGSISLNPSAAPTGSGNKAALSATSGRIVEPSENCKQQGSRPSHFELPRKSSGSEGRGLNQDNGSDPDTEPKVKDAIRPLFDINGSKENT
jgi:hypothetical protein